MLKRVMDDKKGVRFRIIRSVELWENSVEPYGNQKSLLTKRLIGFFYTKPFHLDDWIL